jgi:hypothetical protein
MVAGRLGAPAAPLDAATPPLDAPGEGTPWESLKSAAGRTCRTYGKTTMSELILARSLCPYCGKPWPTDNGAAEETEEGEG